MKDVTHHSPVGALVRSEYDNLFKTIAAGEWCVRSDGHVESPQGYFSITEIPKHQGELAEMIDALELDSEQSAQIRDLAGGISSGWFVTIENSDGIIFVYEMPSKFAAENAYESLDLDFMKWESE